MAHTSDLPELELPAGTLTIADLHLDVEDEASWRPFVDWLGRLPAVPRLIILGDLFEYWIGPAHQELPGARGVLGALAAVAGAGAAIDVVPGNRDFLLDRAFEQHSRCRIRPAGLVGLLPGGARAVFVHGDELATLDRPYQRLRSILRSRPLLWLAPRLPAGVAAAVARRLRRASRSAVRSKPAATMALQPEACRALCARHGAGVLVCGHAHVFRDEKLPSGPRWVVLDAWGGRRDAVVVDEGGALAFEAALGAPRG